jgi:hypothetical protein
MMLCTRCSSPVKPIAVFDIDGTMGDYHQHFINFATEYLGSEGWQDWWKYSGNEGFRDWFCEAFDIEHATWYDIKLAYRQGAQKRSMPPYDGMIDVARAAYKVDCEIWIATTRPYLRLDNIDPDTREWLSRNHVPYDGLLFDEHKYYRLAEIVEPERVVVVYEDLAEMYDEAEIIFSENVPFLVKTSWNRSWDRQNQGTSEKALVHLNDQLRAWRRNGS